MDWKIYGWKNSYGSLFPSETLEEWGEGKERIGLLETVLKDFSGESLFWIEASGTSPIQISNASAAPRKGNKHSFIWRRPLTPPFITGQSTHPIGIVGMIVGMGQ